MNYRVIKENDLFLVTDPSGDIVPGNAVGHGLYTKDTRFLSRFELFVNGVKPVLLSSTAEETYKAAIRLTNPHMERDGELVLWRESVELLRERFISDGTLYESVTFTNYSSKPIAFEASVAFDSDFVDMFVVRGFQHGELGRKTGQSVRPRGVAIGYDGADSVRRETRVEWDREPIRPASDGVVAFEMRLEPRGSETIRFTVSPIVDGCAPETKSHAAALAALERSYADWEARTPAIETDHALFDKLFRRGVSDLRALLTDLGYGPFPVAGLPWYAVPFGRDSLIAALQMLPVQPDVAKGTLFTLARYQGTKVDDWRDETPGKIMHEIRYGELAGTNQIPFTPYYGSVDSTPLFLALAVSYFHWTGDLETIRTLRSSIDQALHWIDAYGDRDGDAFVEYHVASSKGIANQGWKDSGDSIVHDDGEFAASPIALVEVQGYVYFAKTGIAKLYRELGEETTAARLEREAAELKRRFEASFWMEDERYYAIALDKDKRQVRSVTSNPGHLLMTGLTDGERAKDVARRLVADDMFSGYGIRTMSVRSAGYNPMSYHDGSVWPHDNSLALLGLSRMGFPREALAVVEGLFRAAEHFEYYRLPELFCGYGDELGRPVPYPVACSPQAWAAGTPIVFLQTFLGIHPNGFDRTIDIHPALPAGMQRLSVRRLRIGAGTLSLTVERIGTDGRARVTVEHNSTGYETKVLSAE